jgi:hypothetical protein
MVFYKVDNKSAIISIVDVSFGVNYKVDYNNNPYMYGINKDDLQKLILNGSKIKILNIKLNIANESYFQTLTSIHFLYKIPYDNTIFIGNRPDIGPFGINLSPRNKKDDVILTALVDASNLSDEEILDKCKNTSIVMTASIGGKIQTVSNAINIHK